MEKSRLADLAGESRDARDLGVPADTVSLSAGVNGTAAYSLIPFPDGSLRAAFPTSDARGDHCRFATQTWTPVSADAALHGITGPVE